MKRRLLLMTVLACILCSGATSCAKSENIHSESNNSEDHMTGNKIKVKVGSKIFTAKLFDNALAKAFQDLLPLTITMVELNGNEKYFDLAKSLPASSSNPKTIQNGDLMLYGSKTLVLFYKSFSTSYSYTNLGRIDDVEGLADALGNIVLLLHFFLECMSKRKFLLRLGHYTM